MGSWSRWVGIGVALGICAALAPVVMGSVAPTQVTASLSKVVLDEVPAKPEPALFEGLDLTRLELHPRRVSAPLSDSRRAVLTLDPDLQRTATSLMKRHSAPEAGVVLMDVKTGQVLVYASHLASGPLFDVNARAEAPAASVFKLVTAAALVEMAGLSADTEQCYHGGKSRISAGELEDDPARDKWCATLATAMGRSLNVVFARLAKKNLSVEQLTRMAGAFGFGSEVPFELVNEPPLIELPEDPFEFARASAGFWHSSLSPLAGASLAQTIANGGKTLKPRIVHSIERDGEALLELPQHPEIIRRAIKPETAVQLTRMMVQTTQDGSAHKAFFDRKGRPFLPNIVVAGKTGTLSRHEQNRHYTWFVGFAPAEAPEVAIAALVVNTPVWNIKGPDLARDVLRAYFADKGRPGVARP
ncbi:MAG: hypothetical protein RJA70_148 [Pseudomonadota bacterium]|jgi:cell division protein FtsI/penicillin-binding protein 2